MYTHLLDIYIYIYVIYAHTRCKGKAIFLIYVILTSNGLDNCGDSCPKSIVEGPAFVFPKADPE